jgi:hypothetical protein
MGPRSESPSKVQSICMRRYESEELSNVGLDSPRGAHRRSGRFEFSPWLEGGSDEIGLGRRCLRFWGPWASPVLGGETVEQMSSSWCIGRDTLLVWRIVIFLYMLGTYIALAVRGALFKYAISAEIYGLQVVSAFFVILASTLPRLCVATRISEPRSTWSCSSSLDGESVICCNSGHLLRAVTASLVQSAAALAVFWNTVFWVRLESYTSSYMLDRQLLHAYNLIPVVTEVLLGTIPFRLIYFIPSLIFISTYLLLIEQGVNVRGGNEDWVRPLFSRAPNGLSTRPLLVWCILMLSYVGFCFLVFALQSSRRKHLADEYLATDELSYRNCKSRLP